MKPKLYTYNAHAINDASNYNAFIPDNISLQGGSRIVNVSRTGRRPAYASKVLLDYELKITIQMLGTVESQLDQLKTWFDVEDETPRKLIIKDTADSDKQWYVYATVKEMPKLVNKLVYITLSIADPVWYSETENSSTWNVTASAQTKSVTAVGNVNARPKFTITPTTAGGDRFSNRVLLIWKNPMNAAQQSYPLNIVDTVIDTSYLVALPVIHVTIDDGDGITDSDTTITYDGEVGDFPDAGMAYVGTEQFSYSGKTATQLTGCVRGINGTTAAAHADNAVIYNSLIQANGDDLRVYVDGIEVDRWIENMNTVNTKIWINANFSPAIEMTLGASLTNIATTMTLTNSNANKRVFENLPASGTLYIGTELISYTDTNRRKMTISGLTRGINGTTAASHSKNDVAYWIEHEIYLYFGNATAETPDTDDAYKPLIDMANSTNASWVYTQFYDDTGLRSGKWSPSLVKTSNSIDPDHKSTYYTGNRTAIADPATEMGLSLYAFQSGARWKAENGTVEWNFYNPAGIESITVTGEKYRYSTNWPAARLYEKAEAGRKWTTVWTDATPSVVQTWEALAAHSAVAVGSPYIKFSLSGSLPATTDNAAHYEIESVTLALDSDNIPQLAGQVDESCYFINATITNNTTGDYFTVTGSMQLNTDLIIDCENKIARTEENIPVNTLTFSSVRRDWLTLVVGANELQFDDTGTGNATIVINWRDRNS